MRWRPGVTGMGSVLIASFVLTVASFLLSIAVLTARARGIGEAAASIARHAAPAIDHVSRMRTALRHAEVLLDDYADLFAAGVPPRSRGRADIEAQLHTLRAEWNAYRNLPSYPGEPELWEAVTPSLLSVEQASEAVLDRLEAGDIPGGTALLEGGTKAGMDRLDLKLDAVVSYKAIQGATLARRIVSIRQSGRRLSILLGVLCAALGALAALAAVLVVRQYSRLMELRVSELESFAGRVAHDIRSPLTSAALALDLAQRSAHLEPRVQTSLARGTRTLERIGQIVDGLLVFARAGATPTAGVVADAERAVADVIEDLAPSAAEKGIELTAARVETRTVACSPGVLISILSNLVGNAIKYMGDSPVRRIEVGARRVRETACLEVRDTGPGIPDELRVKIFEPYVRASQSAVPGLGLGLATVRRLAEAHGGAAGVEPNGAQGSLFWVQLPLAAPAQASEAPAPPPRRAP